MGLPQYLLLTLIFGLPAYVRDILNLPLFGDRILFLELYIAVVVLISCRLWTRDRGHRYATSASTKALKGSAAFIVQGLLFFSLIFFTICVFHDASTFFAPLQITVFTATLAALGLFALQGNHDLLLDKMNIVLTLIVLWQCLLLAVGSAVPLSLELAAPRNMWPYAAVLAFSLNQHYGRVRSSRYAFISAVALILLNGTRGALALLVIVTLVGWARNVGSKRPIVRVALAVGFVATVVAVHLAVYYYGLDMFLVGSLAELEYAGTAYRGMLSDQFGSLVSRVFSIPYTLAFVIDRNAVIGLGEAAAGQITFWGYPVHNLFVSYFAIFGLFGLAFSILYLWIGLQVAKVSLPAFAIATSLPMVANDLYPAIALCLLPLLTASVTSRSINVFIDAPPEIDKDQSILVTYPK